jgi:putative FmdB family regulatory protein
MPTYDYECSECGYQTEVVCRIADRPPSMLHKLESGKFCPGVMRQIIVAPSIQVDTANDIPWLSEFARTRKEARFGGKPIETRTEYKKYLKENNLRPCDGENLSEV